MGYLICEKCGSYYKLKDGESINDFEGCSCGGKYRLVENLEDYDTSRIMIEKSSMKKDSVNDTKKTKKQPSGKDGRIKPNKLKSEPNKIFSHLSNWFLNRKPIEKILVTGSGLIILILILVFASATSLNLFDSPYATEYTTESDISYIKSCTDNEISFKAYEKNPEKYIGRRCWFEGGVYQIMENRDKTDIIMGRSVPDLYVFYGGTTPIVEGNHIAVFGEAYGSYTYTSQANHKITVPAIKAKYIILVKGDTLTVYPTKTTLSLSEFYDL